MDGCQAGVWMPGSWMDGQACERVDRYTIMCRMVGRKVNACMGGSYLVSRV